MKKMGVFAGIMCVAAVLAVILGQQLSVWQGDGNSETKLVLYLPPTDGNVDGLEQVNQALNEHLKELGAAEVELVMPANYEPLLNSALVKKEQVDIAYVSSADTLAEWIANGWIHPLDELLERQGTDIFDNVSEEYCYYYNDSLMAIATNRDMGSSTVLEYNAELAEQYGIELPETASLEELGTIFEQVKQKCPDLIPIALDWRYVRFWDRVGDSLGVLMDTETKTLVNLYETETFWSMLELFYEWGQKGYLYDLYDNYNFPLAYISSNTIFSIIGEGKPGFEMQETRLTGHRIGSVELRPYTLYSSNKLMAYVIPKTSDDPERAMEILNLFYSDPYIANLLIYGIEGVHYEKTGGNTVHLTGQGDYSGIKGYEYCNQYLSCVMEGEEEDVWEREAEANETGERSAAYGFQFDNSSVYKQVVRCQDVCEEYMDLLFAGKVEPKELREEFCGKLKQAGIDAVIEEKQRQLDRFTGWNSSETKLSVQNGSDNLLSNEGEGALPVMRVEGEGWKG